MFKENRETWSYMIGILIMFIILILITRDFLIPLFTSGGRNIQIKFISERTQDLVINTNLDYFATIRTSLGDITIDLNEKTTPNNVSNFVILSNQGFYNGTYFHRLIPNILIQGGDPNTKDDDKNNDGRGGAGYVIRDELNLENAGINTERITELQKQGYSSSTNIANSRLNPLNLAIASAGPNTNSSQFFIIFENTPESILRQMSGKYTIIGSVVSGLDVLGNINSVEINDADTNSPSPKDNIFINSISIFTR